MRNCICVKRQIEQLIENEHDVIKICIFRHPKAISSFV